MRHEYKEALGLDSESMVDLNNRKLNGLDSEVHMNMNSGSI